MREFILVNRDRGSTLADRVRLAGTSKERRRGLLQARNAGSAVWINPCEAIHTFGMRMPIDSIFVDKQLRVRKLACNLKPRRIAICLRAQSVIELPVGTILHSHTAVGDRLQLFAC